jgi:hypothetical protein
MAIQDELKLFIEEFKRTNGRIPTQNEIVKGTGRAAKTIKSYLVEGVDYAKPLTKLEAARLGGRKLTGPLKVNKNLIKEFNELKIKGIYPSVDTYKSGSKAFRIKFDKKLGLKEIGGPATRETLDKIKTTVSEVIESDNYIKNILPFQTDAEKRKYRTFKRAEYKNQDPRNIYKQLQDYKREKYPNLSFNENIQHGQSKFSTQTLSRFGLLPRVDNVEGPIKSVERIRDNNLKTTLATLNNPDASVAAKKAAAEKYNSIVKGLRGQLKGTNVQGFVNFETFEVDEKGNFKKIKDIGFDPKKGMAYNNILGNKPLDKLTDAEANEILKIGKKHIDLQLLPKTIPGIKKAVDLPVPEKTKVREMFQTAFKKAPKKGKLGLAAAGALALTGTASADELPIKYNDEIGAFVDPKTDDKVSQSTLLNWAADNPMPTAAVASAPLLSKTVRKGAGKLLSGLLSTLGSSAAGLTFAGMTVKGNLEDGKNIVDATVDPMVGIELLYPEAAKRFGGKGLQNALGRALSLGRVGAMMTPVGMGITALGIGKSLYNIAQEEQDRINEMRENDPIAYQEYLKEQQEFMDVSA